ncbi:hypothetical protein TEA_015541 [Camellia sinensis var. sinensis]|uniref:MBD domain-containing protein n=1 Tax=Camellia sinensis var. sinensis TaxID=542762 RepID=A0A4S4CXS2_CAMSN|nr:hypothetical protein TEA_015541 [Camellia sinensis var. sinensis]
MADSIPDGWHAEDEIGKNGKEIKIPYLYLRRVMSCGHGYFAKSDKSCYKNDIGQTFYSEQDLMRYINYAKRAKVSIYAPNALVRLLQFLPSFMIIIFLNYLHEVPGGDKRPNPPKVRKEAEKEAAGKQCSKGLMHASNESDEESNNPEVVSLPSELPKKVRHDKAPNSTSVFDDEVAEFHLSNYYQ